VSGATVRAAGGAVVRRGPDGVEVLLIHRRRYDDWTLPKGKVERGETDEACALREVEEETGLLCTLGEELPMTHYEHDGRPKQVRYWVMEVRGGVLAPRPGEIDDARWLGLSEARRVVTYAHDLDVLGAVARA
jgi:8-oxo-dGTP diphosphatase